MFLISVFSSGVPFFLFLVLLPFSIPWMEVDSVWICVVHYLACLCPTVGSVVYHVFMNHVGGEHVYDTLLSLDMFGVCLVNTLGVCLMQLTMKNAHTSIVFGSKLRIFYRPSNADIEDKHRSLQYGARAV